MSKKLIAGINTDGGPSRLATRRAQNTAEVWVRQMTFEDGVEAELTMWADGAVAVTVKRMNSGKELLRWRSDQCDCRAAELNAPAHSENCALRKGRP